MAKSIEFEDLGVISYSEALGYMQDLHVKRCQNEIANTLLVLEHHPVITKGRRLQGVSIPNESSIKLKGIDIVEADRGGLLTYHGPGQIVVYFILKVEDFFSGVNDLVTSLEAVLQNFLAQQNIESKIISEHPGIWVGQKKIASIGLRVSNGVTRHGISLNISNDLSVYQLFDPCGMAGNVMTNLAEVKDQKISQNELDELKLNLVNEFKKQLEII